MKSATLFPLVKGNLNLLFSTHTAIVPQSVYLREMQKSTQVNVSVYQNIINAKWKKRFDDENKYNKRYSCPVLVMILDQKFLEAIILRSLFNLIKHSIFFIHF